MTPDGVGGIGRAAGGGLLDSLRSGRIQDPRARLKAATSLLEGSFYRELFKVMRETVPEGGLVKSGAGEEIFSSLMDGHLAEMSAARSERGLGRALYRHFVEMVAEEPEASTGDSGDQQATPDHGPEGGGWR